MGRVMRGAGRARGVRRTGGAGAGRAARGRRGAAAGVLLAASLAVAGCGAAGDDSARSASMADRGAAPERAADGARQNGGAAQEDGAPKPGGTAGSGAGRAADNGTAAKAAASRIIRTATVTVETKDVPTAVARARAAADGAGGYVGDETTDQDNAGHDRSRIVLRVPPEEYDAVLGRLSRLGTLVSREVSAKDVTDQVVDIDSRISSQRASVTRVRKLMEKATTISDIVSLESELNTRESSLESLEAQLKSLKERTGTATVTLVVRRPDADPPRKPEADGPTSFGDALAGGWHAFTAAVRWVLVVIGAVLPFAVAAGLLYTLWRMVRDRIPAALRSRRGRSGTAAPRVRRPSGTSAEAGAADAPGTAAAAATAPAAPRTADIPQPSGEAAGAATTPPTPEGGRGTR
ncbi:DUF4349 domain-containing protein [Streptomyces sp. NPDC091266]|uniref:DUF4349 domain-containing protein n=1 Tax=Streptomyces sp. NPDC091266 TaxID=3365978 RepID=UPI0037F29679